MGKMQRDKGQRGEREIVAMFVEVMEAVERDHGGMSKLSEMVKRNTLQSDRGGFDVANIPLLAVEVKRAETLSLNAWWGQAVEQAKNGEVPVLFYRQSRKPWRCVCYTALCEPTGEFIKYVVSNILAEDFIIGYRKTYLKFLAKHNAERAI